MNPTNKQRREFLTSVAAALATAATSLDSAPADAQTIGERRESLRVVDFHKHLVGSAFTPIVGAGSPPARRAYFDAVNRNLADPKALQASIETAGIAARVINTPVEFIQES